MSQSASMIRVKYVLSHPIQYFVPLIQRLARSPGIDLQVIYAVGAGAQEYYDPYFGRTLKWDVPLLDGYHYTILHPDRSYRPGSFFLSVPSAGVARQLRRERTDVAIIHGWGTLFNLTATGAAWLNRVPVIYRTDSQLRGQSPSLRSRLKPLLLDPLLRRIQGFLSFGALNRDYYVHAGVDPARIFFAPSSIDSSRFMEQSISEADRRAAVEKEGLRPDSFKVLFVGKLMDYKRPGDVIQAVAGLESKDRIEVILVGEGPLSPALQQLARERGVHASFLGFRNQAELPLLYSLSDVLVLPSQFEPWGLVVNEAMSLGIPAIVSDAVGAGPDLVVEDVSGYRYPVGDTPALARALEKMVSSKELHQRLRQGARERVSQFSLDFTLAGYLTAIQSVARGSSR